MEHLHNYTLRQLQWLRALVSLTVLVGIGISVAMNVLNAPPTLTAQIVSTIPPILVFGAIELIARIPAIGKLLTYGRIIGACVVASGAASISYAHQRAAVLGLGFQEWESYIWPAIIDGFMIVASVSLVSVVTLIRQKKIADEPVVQRRKQADAGLKETPAAIKYRLAAAQQRIETPVLVPQTVLNGSKPAIAAAKVSEPEA